MSHFTDYTLLFELPAVLHVSVCRALAMEENVLLLFQQMGFGLCFGGSVAH